MMMMKQSFSHVLGCRADIIIRDKLWPMPKHGSALLYVHRNRKAHWTESPRRPARLSHSSWTLNVVDWHGRYLFGAAVGQPRTVSADPLMIIGPACWSLSRFCLHCSSWGKSVRCRFDHESSSLQSYHNHENVKRNRTKYVDKYYTHHPNVPKLCSLMNKTSKSKNVKLDKFISCIFEVYWLSQ